MSRTGGDKRHWLFDPHQVENDGAIRDALLHYDKYFEDEPEEPSTLAIVLDRLLEDLEEDLAECVRLVYLEGRTYRDVGRTLNIDHKTAKGRAERGVAAMKRRLLDSSWISEMLRGYIPKDEIIDESPRATVSVADVLQTLGGDREQE